MNVVEQYIVDQL